MKAQKVKSQPKAKADKAVPRQPAFDAAGCLSRPGSGFTTSRQLADLKVTHEWLIRQVLVAGQPGVIGGPAKSLKTSLVIDAAISLGSGTRFLNRFSVPERSTVAVFSGESGPATIKDTANRVCQSKGISLEDCDVLWNFTLPRLGDPAEVKALGRELGKHGVRVVVIDPLFLCLTGGESISPSNLYQVGPVLHRVAAVCLEAGATPLIVHHTTKEASRPRNTRPDLMDLAFAGIAEYSRQWLLLNRRHEFDPLTGTHRLRMMTGGSAGQSGTWDLEICEGTMRSDLTGRRWEPQVSLPAEGS